MALTSDQISQAIRAQLKILDPELSLDPLTPERKIVDTVSEVIADAQADQNVINYSFDIDTKVGTDLDRFVALFGFARQAGRRATGTVTFSRTAAATQDIFIPPSTQVVKPATSVSPAVIFFTTAGGIIYTGTSSVDIPVEATEVGELGNISANSITALATGTATDVSLVNNAVATSGGTTYETDVELRIRFKNTIFRNVSGTADQYLALAISSQFSQKANVLGPISRFVEYLQIPTVGTANSQIPYAKFTYTYDYYLTDGNPQSEIFYNASGADYTFNSTLVNPQTVPRTAVAPTITVNNTTNLPAGKVLLLEHSYCSINSRNDPANNVMNKVDVFVSGTDPVSATESVLFATTANNVNTVTPANAFYYKKWQREGTQAFPLGTSRIQPLLWQPITQLPSSIQIGVTTLRLNTDYWLVHDYSDFKGSRRGRDGIEWSASAAAAVTAGTAFSLSYTFNRLPLSLNELMDSHKQVTSDVLVHGARLRYLNINIVIMYTPGFTPSSVDTAISTAMADFFSKMQFGALIQLSDIEDTIHDVPGVDNVRITSPADGISYGVQEVGSDGTTFLGFPYTNDFALLDSDLPVLNKITTTRKSQNTWSFG